jgi:hypothetical protein
VLEYWHEECRIRQSRDGSGGCYLSQVPVEHLREISAGIGLAGNSDLRDSPMARPLLDLVKILAAIFLKEKTS